MSDAATHATADAAPSDAALFAAYALPERAVPRLRVNFVSSLDGAVTLGGRSGALGTPDDQRLMTVLRTLADVIVVGAGTVRAEGYGGLRLPAESVAWRRARGLSDQPPLAVVSASLGLDPAHPFFSEAVVRPLVLTHAAAPAERREALAEVAEVIDCGAASVEPATLVRALTERGMPQQLCEGGPHLFGELLTADLVDELCLSLSPVLVAGGAGRIAQGAAEAARRMRLLHALPAGDMLLLRYARAR
ncbi:riboflavin biosynthesis pyrimidine reductase [Microterricola gilva]|uniref:Riboflavin biosynthesis pyrimidine reductase n=1 Tax=Microterricola gilva TaxID=393267 RepID=A0A4Q8ANN2_9MICO|nr:pyrimidine reductase family protein [Microterricola gilva]RZU66158.1 riboflavin biosynthesis pyrimidine reductase [Microterricola gilva]